MAGVGDVGSGCAGGSGSSLYGRIDDRIGIGIAQMTWKRCVDPHELGVRRSGR